MLRINKRKLIPVLGLFASYGILAGYVMAVKAATSERPLILDGDLSITSNAINCGGDRICGTTDDSYTEASPGDDIRYNIEYQNLGNTSAEVVVINEVIPTGTCYKINSLTKSPENTYIEFSKDKGKTWTTIQDTKAGRLNGLNCEITNIRITIDEVSPSNIQVGEDWINEFNASGFSGTESKSLNRYLDVIKLKATPNYLRGTNAGGIQSTVVGDFNNDGINDIATGSMRLSPNDGSERVCLGTPTGFSTNCTSINLIGGETWLANVGDFNGDKYDDLVFTNHDYYDEVTCNGSSEGIILSNCRVLTGTGGTSTSAIVEDFNKDGFDDVVIANGGNGDEVLCSGSVNGLTPETCKKLITGGTSVNQDNALTKGDYNNDGHIDLIIANYQDVNEVVCYGTSEGLQAANCRSIPNTLGSTTEVITHDFNIDGYDDVLIGNSNIGSKICFGSISGIISETCQNISDMKLPAVGYGSSWLSITDMNNDSYGDLVFIASVGSRVCYGTPQGLTISTQSCSYLSSNIKYPKEVLTVEDFNNDGIGDIVITTTISFNDATIELCLGQEDIRLSLVPSSCMNLGNYKLIASPTGSTTGYINNDSFKDIIIGGYRGDVLLCRGDNSTQVFNCSSDDQVQTQGTYKTFVSANNIGSWKKLNVRQNTPEGTSIDYTIRERAFNTTNNTYECTTIYVMKKADENGDINLSNISPNINSLCIEAKLTTNNSYISPYLDGWTISYGHPISAFSFDVQVIARKVDSIINNIKISSNTYDSNMNNNTSITSLVFFRKIEVIEAGPLPTPVKNMPIPPKIPSPTPLKSTK